jgi:hypothetical protein
MRFSSRSFLVPMTLVRIVFSMSSGGRSEAQVRADTETKALS